MVTISAADQSLSASLREVWVHRELLYFFVWRDVKVRYKQTVLGVAWAILQPLLTVGVFTVFFGKLANMPSEGVPYFLFAFAALAPWNLLASGVAQASHSLVSNHQLITKVYFPRLLLPIAAVLAPVVDFSVTLVLLLVLCFSYGLALSSRLLCLAPLIVLAMIAASSTGMILAALNVRYRDVRHLIPFLIQIWLFATPIVYPASLIKSEWHRAVYSINPMVGVVEGFRWALFGTAAQPVAILISSISALALSGVGLVYFHRKEYAFADIV